MFRVYAESHVEMSTPWRLQFEFALFTRIAWHRQFPDLSGTNLRGPVAARLGWRPRM